MRERRGVRAALKVSKPNANPECLYRWRAGALQTTRVFVLLQGQRQFNQSFCNALFRTISHGIVQLNDGT
jgi:hypothetical protein